MTPDAPRPGGSGPPSPSEPVDPSVVPAELSDPCAPEKGRLHVWILDVTAPWYDALADSGLASERERARAEALTRADLARSLLARRAALRCVLGRYLKCGPGSVEVVTAPGGKPVLLPGGPSGASSGDRVVAGRIADAASSGRTIAFSVGHSGDLYGIVLGTATSVGFDVERRRAIPRADAIARRWFGASEAAALEGLADEALEEEFMRLWTGKEALAKRHGAGLRLMMRGDTRELDTEAEASDGRLRWLRPRPGYHAAVASSDVVRGVTVVVPDDDSWIP